MLEQIINQLAEKITKKRGFRTPYELIIQPELPMDDKGRERIVIIQAGTPPLIRLSHLYIVACVSGENKEASLPGLRETIEKSLEILPKMYHTLSLIPTHQAIALRRDTKKWVKATIPKYNTMLDDRFFELSYSVTVTDKVTGTSITRNGNDLKVLELDAKKSLSRMILENEELEEYRDNIIGSERAKSLEVKPNTVSLSIGNGVVETKLEY